MTHILVGNSTVGQETQHDNCKNWIMDISAHPNGYRAVSSIKEGCKFFPYFLLQTKFIFARNESSPDRRRDGFFAPFWDTLKYRVIQLSDQERSTIWYAFHGIHVRRGDGNKMVYFSSWLKIRVSFIVRSFFCINELSWKTCGSFLYLLKAYLKCQIPFITSE